MASALKIKLKMPLSRENSFYREYYHLFLYALMIVIFIVILGIGIAFYQSTHRALPQFSATDLKKNNMRLEPFSEPNLLPDTITRWASKAATLAYSFDYLHYNEQLRTARPFFTEAGWQDYLSSIQGTIDTIVKNQLVVNGVVSGTPVISNQGPLPGKGYTWRVQIPFLVTYQTANAPTLRRYLVLLTIVRVPTHLNPQGIGVDQFVMANPTR